MIKKILSSTLICIGIFLQSKGAASDLFLARDFETSLARNICSLNCFKLQTLNCHLPRSWALRLVKEEEGGVIYSVFRPAFDHKNRTAIVISFHPQKVHLEDKVWLDRFLTPFENKMEAIVSKVELPYSEFRIIQREEMMCGEKKVTGVTFSFSKQEGETKRPMKGRLYLLNTEAGSYHFTLFTKENHFDRRIKVLDSLVARAGDEEEHCEPYLLP